MGTLSRTLVDMFWSSPRPLRNTAAALLVAGLALTGCTADDNVTATAVPVTSQATGQPTDAVPSATAPDSPQGTATEQSNTTTPPPATATDLPTTAGTQTTGLTGHAPDPTSGPRTKKFGGVTTYADKSAIRVAPPQPFTPTGGAPGTHVVVTITVINSSPAAAPIDFWYIAAEVDGQPVEPITDGAQGVGMPTGDLAPGQERTFKMAYPKKPAQKLTLQVVWRDGYIFTYEL